MEESKRVVIAGATGFIGRELCRHLLAHGYEVMALSRNAVRAKKILGDKVRVVEWNGKSEGEWYKELAGAAAVINLSGENVGRGSWSPEKMDRILKSRVDSASAFVWAFKNVEVKPDLFIQASAIGYYGDGGERVLSESVSQGNEFLSVVVSKCESLAKSVEEIGIRTAVIRTAFVLGRDGGVLPRMIKQCKNYMGGFYGSGNQWLSWIHIEDEVVAIRFLIESGNLKGPFNLASPAPLRVREFYEILGRVLQRPIWLFVPSFFIRLFMGLKGKELFLSNKRVEPDRLLKSGFKFRYPTLEQALRDLSGH